MQIFFNYQSVNWNDTFCPDSAKSNTSCESAQQALIVNFKCTVAKKDCEDLCLTTVEFHHLLSLNVQERCFIVSAAVSARWHATLTAANWFILFYGVCVWQLYWLNNLNISVCIYFDQAVQAVTSWSLVTFWMSISISVRQGISNMAVQQEIKEELKFYAVAHPKS